MRLTPFAAPGSGARVQRPGTSLIEVLMVAALLGVCAAGVTGTWHTCYHMNREARMMQAAKNVLEQEMERVRRLNWTGLTEQTTWATRYYYNRNGAPVGPPGAASPVPGGYASYIKVETMTKEEAYLLQSGTVDATGGNSRSLKRVTVRVQPTGRSVDASPRAAEAVTHLTLGGP